MDECECRITDYINTNHIQAEHLVFETSCHSVEEAAASANARMDEFVKNICVMADEKNLIVAIMPGERKLDMNKLASSICANKIRMAKSEEILLLTGYPAGGTPSFGYSARFFMDSSVIDKPIVFSGGGSRNSLIRVSPKEIVRINGATIADLVNESKGE